MQPIPMQPMPEQPIEPATPEQWADYQQLVRQRFRLSIAATASAYLSLASFAFVVALSSPTTAALSSSLPTDPWIIAKLGIALVVLFLLAVLYLFYNLGSRTGIWNSMVGLSAPAYAPVLLFVNLALNFSPIMVIPTLLIGTGALTNLLCQLQLGTIRPRIGDYRDRWGITGSGDRPPPPPERDDTLEVDRGWDEGARK